MTKLNKETPDPQLRQTAVVGSAVDKEQFAINFMCWCEENKGWINSYSNKQKIIIFKKESEYDTVN